MQEFQLPIAEMLTKGMRPDTDARGFLTQCKFARSTPYGLKMPEAITNPFSATKFTTFPNKQLLRGNSVTLLAGSTTVEEVTEGSPWTTELLSTGTITAGDIWQLVDMHTAWMLLNGATVVYKDNSKGMFNESQPVIATTATDINAGTYFKGRVLLGGFDPDNYWSDDWQSAIKHYSQAFPFAIDDTSLGYGNNFVFWSTIGGGDVFQLFNFKQSVYGNIREDRLHDPNNPMFMELLQRNELGLAPMPWQGLVMIMKPLNNGVAVYGADGIAILTPANIPYPTFGINSRARFGIAGRGCVAGNEEMHVFVSATGELWTLTADGVLTKLGYKEYISKLLDYDIVVSFDEVESEYHISGKNTGGEALSFLLSKNGLTQSPYQVTSVCQTADGLTGVFSETDNVDVIITTDSIDFGDREFKTITLIELGLVIETEATAQVAIQWRNKPSEAFNQTVWVTVNREGFCYIRSTAHEFKILVTVNNYADFELSYINIHWQPSGRRTRRGLSADQARQ